MQKRKKIKQIHVILLYAKGTKQIGHKIKDIMVTTPTLCRDCKHITQPQQPMLLKLTHAM